MVPERPTLIRCAIYTRKSSEEGLEQAFNSLDAQREACLAYIESQRHEGWRASATHYDDGGYSGGTLERPALEHLLADVDAGRIETVVVYKVDRLTRALTDFAKIVERFDAAGVSFVSVTQHFNTTSSMGRLTLNVLLSFAQFEREVTGERIRDKIAASKQKGMWMGGTVPLGYTRHDRTLRVIPEEAAHVREIFDLYLKVKCVRRLKVELDRRGITSKRRISHTGQISGGGAFSRGALYTLLKNRLYCGQIAHREAAYPGQHEAIVSPEVWEAVQVQLAANRHATRTGTRAKNPSLLAGLLVDEHGYRMTPKHTLRRGKRYRYYVSQACIQGAGMPGRVSTLPAHQIEQTVLQGLQDFIAKPQAVLDRLALPSDDAAVHKALLTGATAWQDLATREPAQMRAVLLATVRNVVVDETHVQMMLSRAGLRTVLLRGPAKPQGILKRSRNREDHEDDLHLSIPVRLTRCGGGTRLIVPGESGGERRAKPNGALIKAVARAHVWAERLLSGQAPSLRAIAREHGVTERYVGRLLRCTFLAPDLVESILEGRHPPELTLRRLLEDLPLDWAEQRQALSLM